MSRKQAEILVTLLLGVFMGALDIFIVSPALGAIQTGLGIAPRLITWSFTAYTLVLVISQPLVAKLSDTYGRRWIYVACVALFGAGSGLCAVATGFGPFILGRCIQAIGAGGVIPVASAVIADIFPEERRGTALGLVGSVFGLAFIAGPIIGGVLTQGLDLGGHTTDWHAIFIVNIPLAVAIIVLASRTLPVQPARRSRGLPFDWNGAFLLGAALFCLVFGLTQITFSDFAANFNTTAAAPFIVLGLAFLVPLWLNEARVASPIIDTRAFSRRQLIIAMLLSAAGGIITSSIVYVPQLVENAFHLKAGAGGFYLLFVALTLFLGTPMVGRMIDRVGSRAMVLTGGLLGTVGFALLLTANTSRVGIIFALLLIGLGLSTFVGTPLRYIVVNEAAPQRRASSLAVLTVCSSVGQTIVLPLGGALIASALVAAGHPTGVLADQTTFQAIHGYYGIVLAILAGATLLSLGLKTHSDELADRRMRQRTERHTTATTHQPTSAGQPSAQPAMSSR